ncbi:MAG: hypothetical protein AVDCRST_MAG06-1108 [uncultured Nocardioides sp.]|uniref:Uncharacterized protein n=1 Tax=uncultured Nocardioides sp. TaxID=198441 RepID=A0A6J4NF64_9ACTN|nr:MAG: hypothetical protein AVDCRST_MAG06-1108 [uncultured Nocardioides sp.]
MAGGWSVPGHDARTARPRQRPRACGRTGAPRGEVNHLRRLRDTRAHGRSVP